MGSRLFLYKGIVIYTGYDTKIMCNDEKSKPKVSTIENMTNKYILFIIAL